MIYLNVFIYLLCLHSTIPNALTGYKILLRFSLLLICNKKNILSLLVQIVRHSLFAYKLLSHYLFIYNELTNSVVLKPEGSSPNSQESATGS